MDPAKFPLPAEGFVVTHMLIVADIGRSVAFYRDVLGGEVVFEGGVDTVQRPSIVQLANTWIIINVGGGPTEDKPDVTVAPPADPNLVSSFLNLRVADIQACYQEWSAKGAHFLTEPQDRGAEIRCYLRDPDGHLIEVGQTTGLVSAD